MGNENGDGSRAWREHSDVFEGGIVIVLLFKSRRRVGGR